MKANMSEEDGLQKTFRYVSENDEVYAIKSNLRSYRIVEARIVPLSLIYR